MPRNNFIDLNTVNPIIDNIQANIYVKENQAYYWGENIGSKQRIIIVNPKTYDDLMNPFRYSYEDIETSIP